MNDVKQNTTRPFKIYMADSADPTAGKAGLSSFTVYLAKSGGVEATVAPTIAERGHGFYEVTPIASHRDTLGESAWTFTATGAFDSPKVENVVAYDSQVAAVGANTTAPLDATGTRSAMGLASANLDAQIGTLSTFDESTDQVVVATNNDKTDYSLTVSERSTLAGVIEAEFLDDLTGGAFLAGITSQVQALFDSGVDVPVATLVGLVASQVRTELATELARLDATVSSRSSHAAPDLSRLDVNVSSRSSHAAPTIPTVGEIRDELETVGGKLDDVHGITEDDSGARRLTENAFDHSPSSGGGSGDASEATSQLILGKLTGAVVKVVDRTINGTNLLSYIGDDDVGDNAQVIKIDDVGGAIKAKLEAATSRVFAARMVKHGVTHEITGTVGTIQAVGDQTHISVDIASENKATSTGVYTYHVKEIDDTANEYVRVTGKITLSMEIAEV